MCATNAESFDGMYAAYLTETKRLCRAMDSWGEGGRTQAENVAASGALWDCAHCFVELRKAAPEELNARLASRAGTAAKWARDALIDTVFAGARHWGYEPADFLAAVEGGLRRQEFVTARTFHPSAGVEMLPGSDSPYARVSGRRWAAQELKRKRLHRRALKLQRRLNDAQGPGEAQ